MVVAVGLLVSDNSLRAPKKTQLTTRPRVATVRGLGQAGYQQLRSRDVLTYFLSPSEEEVRSNSMFSVYERDIILFLFFVVSTASILHLQIALPF